MDVTEHSLLIAGHGVRRVEFTVKEYARLEKVDERTVRRWIVKGAVSVRRTPGGGVRIVERQNS
jgi:predicted site-specific integrase-resolvase